MKEDLLEDAVTKLRVITPENIRKLVDSANEKGILQCDIVSIQKFGEQYCMFYYN